jgi:putative transposase
MPAPIPSHTRRHSAAQRASCPDNALVIDLFPRFVVGWAVSGRTDRHLAVEALEMVLERRRPSSSLLHHTDRGSPYASKDFQQVLEVNGMVCSMSGAGNCCDDAVVERFLKTFKAEEGEDFERASDVRAQTFDDIEAFFNQTRLHSTLGYLSTAHYEKDAASIRQAA